MLLARLDEVQRSIRRADLSSVASPVSSSDETLIALFGQERRILAELKRRRAILERGISWTVSRPHP